VKRFCLRIPPGLPPRTFNPAHPPENPILTRTLALAASLLALAATEAGAGLTPYRSEAEWVQVLKHWREAAQKLQAQRRRESAAGAMPAAPSQAAPAAAMAKAADSSAVAEGQVTGGRWHERIEERRRVGFAPAPARDGRHSPFN
jgi:hypothetical protein